MTMYTFYVIQSTSSVAAIDMADLDDDAAATEHGALLCEQRKACVRLEIWQDERLVVDTPCADAKALGAKRQMAPEPRS